MQRALLQYYRPEMRSQVIRALRLAGRSDLIGTGPDCLVPPEPAPHNSGRQKARTSRSGQKRPGRAVSDRKERSKTPNGKRKTGGRKPK